MNNAIRVIEEWVRRRGIVLPRLYLLGVLAVLFGLVSVMAVPSCREFLATVILHDYFVVCVIGVVGPLFLCDPIRGKSAFWAAFHLVCLSAAGLLTFFFLTFCDLLARDDRAFLSLLSCFVAVLVGRLYVADFVIAFAAKATMASGRGRKLLLSAYARMLDVDHARVGLPALGLTHGLVLSIRERILRVLGLRRTRSRAIEDAFFKFTDRLAAEADATPSLANLRNYAFAMISEIALHRVILVSRVVHSRDIAERWPAGFIDRWTVLLKAYQRCASRVRGTLEEAELVDLRAKVLLPILESAQDNMRIIYTADNIGDKNLTDAILAFRTDGRVSSHALRVEFDRSVLFLRRPGVSPKSKLAFMVLAQATAEAAPADFLAVYGDEKAGSTEWGRAGLPPLLHAVCTVIAFRRQLESGGLSTSQSGPVFARLFRASAHAGFTSSDYPESAWGALLRSASLQWGNFAKGLKAHLIEQPLALSEQDEPGVGRISIANAFAVLVLACTVIFFTLVSPVWISKEKVFHDVFGPYFRAQAKARSIDLSSDGGHVGVATADQGLLLIDARNYGVRQIGAPEGLSSNELKDVIALSKNAFAVSTEGVYGAKGLDLVKEGRASPVIGLNSEDLSSLTAEPPLTMVNVGRDALFVFRKGLLFYDQKSRMLTAVPGAPDNIIGACGSKFVDGRAWLLVSAAGKNTVKEVVRDSRGNFAFQDLTSGLAVNPDKIFHDGISLWCVDRAQSGVYHYVGASWQLRAGSPSLAKASGGVAAAESLAISRCSSPAVSDALWMVKSGKVFVRSIPHDALQAELPWPWKEAATIEKDYLGEVHAFAVEDIGYLIVPYPDKLLLISHRESLDPTKSVLLLPKVDSRLRSIDVGSSEVAIASEDKERSQVYLMDFRRLCGLAQGQVRATWPDPLQSSAFLSEAFKLNDIAGVCKVGSLTYHFDTKGKWLKHDSSLHGLVNSGAETVPIAEPAHLLDRLKRIRVRSVSQSEDGAKAIVASNYGLHELELTALGAATPAVNTLFSEPANAPAFASEPFGVSDTKSGPEVYFYEAKTKAQSEDDRKLARIWRLNDHLSLRSSWLSQSAGPGSLRVFADSITRVRTNRADGEIFYGSPVALNDDHMLVTRDPSDDVWKASGVAGVWAQIANSPEGSTVIRMRAGEKFDGDVTRISQLTPSGGRVTERTLWTVPSFVPKGELVNPLAVIPVYGRGMVFPTDEGFWAYQPLSRSWTRLMDHAPGKITTYKVLSDVIRHPSGASIVSWWADGSSNVYGVGASRAVSFGSVGNLSHGVAAADTYVSLTDKNGLYSFSLGDGSTRKLFAPIAPVGGASSVGALESSEKGLVFLPFGGGQVLTIDDDDQFLVDKGPVMKSIATVDGRLVGISGVKGEDRLVSVFSPAVSVGTDLVSMHSLGDVAVAMSSSGSVWMAGFSGGVLYGRIIGNSKASESPLTPAKINAAISFEGQLFMSVDGGIHFRPDLPAPDEVPGFHKIAWNPADWFRVIEGLGKLAPVGGLGCYSISDKVELSLITKTAKGDFKVTSGLDIPIAGPGSGIVSLFKQGPGGKVVPYDDSNRITYGGATCLGKNARVHPMDSGLLVLTRSSGAGIAFYDPATGTDSLLGFIRTDGTRIASPFGTDVDFLYRSESPVELPFIGDGRVLGRISSNHADVEVLSERAQSPIVQSGSLMWIEDGHLMGAAASGGGYVSKTPLPDMSGSSAALSTSGVLIAGAGDRMSAVVDSFLVDVDLKADKFKKIKPADLILPQANGVIVANRRPADTWVLSDGTVALPGALTDLGTVHLAFSAKFIAAYDPFSGGGEFRVRAATIVGSGANLSYSCRLAPKQDLLLGPGVTVQSDRRLLHVEHEKVFCYDIDRGEWSEPDLPPGFKASSVRKFKDGKFYVIDEESADAMQIQSDINPLAASVKARAFGLSFGGALVGTHVSPDGLVSIKAGQRHVRSDLDGWKRHDILFSRESLSFNGPRSDLTLVAESPSSPKAAVYIRQMGKLARFDLDFQVPFSALFVCAKPDGLVVTDGHGFVRHIDVSIDGQLSLFDEPFGYAYLGRAFMPSRAPAGWVKVAGKFYHESGYEEGMVIKPGVPINFSGKQLKVSVRKVTYSGDVEVLEEVTVESADIAGMSVIHPDFAKIKDDDSAQFERAIFYSGFNGKRLPAMPRKVVKDAPARIDQVRHLAVIDSTLLCQLDGQGGMWARDPVSGIRKYIREVSADARFIYSRLGDDGEIVVVLETDGKRFIISPDATLTPVGGGSREFSATISGFSRRVGDLRANAGAKGFDLLLSDKFSVSIAPDGWRVKGASSEPRLRLTSDGSLLLEFISGDATSSALLHVPATGERRFLSAKLVASGDFMLEPKIGVVSAGGYSFSGSAGALVVTHGNVSRPISFVSGGGIEPDHYARVISVSDFDRRYLINASGASGRIYVRRWESGRLGPLREISVSPSASGPSLAVSVDDAGYLKYGAEWHRLEVDESRAQLLRLEASPVAGWGELKRTPSNPWAMEGGRVYADAGAGWEEVPCRSDPVAFAFDLPSPLFADFRSLGGDRLIFKSRVSEGSRPLWYSLKRSAGIPGRFLASVPEAFVPPEKLTKPDSLGNEMVFSRSNLAGYILKIKNGVEAAITLTVTGGSRLPHLGEFANPVVSGRTIFLEAGKTSDLRQLFLQVPDDTSAQKLSLVAPVVDAAAMSVGPSPWWINEDKVSIAWNESNGLVLGLKQDSGVMAYAKIGSYAGGRAFEIDDPAQVIVRDVRTDTLSFSPKNSPEDVVVIPTVGLGSLANVFALEVLPEVSSGKDVFRDVAQFSPEEMRPIDVASGRIKTGDFSCNLISGSRIEISPGLEIPLYRLEQLGVWTTPQGDVVSGLRLADGRLVVQSCGGGWLSCYSATGTLLAGRFLELPEVTLLRWANRGRGRPALEIEGGSVGLNLPNLSDGAIESPGETHVVEAGLSVVRGAGRQFKMELGDIPVDPSRYPSVDILGVSLAGDILALSDPYGLRNLVSGSLTKVATGELVRRSLGTVSVADNLDAKVRCGAWTIVLEDGKLDVLKGNKSILDSSGIPYVDSISDFDGYDKFMIFEHAERLVLADSSLIVDTIPWGIHEALVNRRSARLAVSTLNSNVMIDFGGLVTLSYDVSRRTLRDGDPCWKPLAVLSGSKTEFHYNESGAFEMRVTLADGDLGPPSVRYVGKGIFVGNQLVSDHVASITSEEGALFVHHPASVAESKGWLERVSVKGDFLMSPVRRRGGPADAVPVPSSLTHPWSELRIWGLDGGRVIWNEAGGRWGY